MDKAHTKCIKWPVSPKMKEIHLKIIHTCKIYLLAEFLIKRFKFEVDPCTVCNESEETSSLMFHVFLMPVSLRCWTDMYKTILK